MKKIIFILSLLLSLNIVLCECFSQKPVMVIPDSDSIGESKIFEKEGIKLTL